MEQDSESMRKHSLLFLYDFVFPNMFLPNALITEYGIVNYLSSLHARQVSSGALYKEHGFNDQTIGGTLYEAAFGNHPNTQPGSHMASTWYSDYFEYTQGSLFEWQHKVNKYFYPIRISPNVNDFIGISHPGSKSNGEYFWKHMSTMALQDAQQGKAIIFIDHAQENFIEYYSYVKLHESLANSGIPKNNIILAFNSFNAKEVYERWFPEEERRLQVKNWPFVMTNTAFHYYSNPRQRMTVQEFKDTKTTIRNKHFIFKIRRPRDHRLAFLYKIATDGLLEKADWSCLTPIQFDQNNVLATQNRYQFDFDSDKIAELCNNIPHTLDSEQGSTYNTVSAWTDATPDSHKNSYLYLCTETYTTGEYKSLTEKVFKPIVNFQPFLFAAYPGALELLRSLGFKTFSPFIDESYDDEPDDIKRMGMIYAELNRICSMSKEEIHDWYWEMEEILIHNHTHFLEIWKNEVHTKELINYMILKAKL